MSACLVAVTLLSSVRTAPAQDAILVLSPGPTLSTVAGTGKAGYGGDGAAGTLAGLASPSGMAYDAAGNLFVADTRNHRVRKLSATGTVTTVAGSGVQGFGGDDGAATAALLDSPLGVAVAADGTIYIADTRNQRVRRVALDGTITTVAGAGGAGFGGDTGPAIAASLRNPAAVALGLRGELYIADAGNHRVRRVALDGTIATIAGNGREESTGDGGPALLAGLDAPSGLAVRATDGALLIADRLNSRVRIVTTDGTIATLPAGAALRRVSGLSVDAGGTVYLADRGNFRLRAVTANGSGVLLGSGQQGSPDATVAYDATPLGAPYAIVPDASGGVTFSDRDHAQVQHLALPQLSFATTVAGQTSPAQTLLLTNDGGASLVVSAVTITGSFAVGSTGSCGVSPFTLAVGTACTVSVAFAPAAAGPQGGVLSVLTGGLPQRALLQGTAVAAGVLLPSSTVLRSSGNLSYAGVPVSLQAQVLASGTAAPTGTVHLLDASTELARGTVDGTGAAAFTVTSLLVGQHALMATYDGDARYNGSTSAVQTQTVVAPPDFTLVAASSSLSMAAGSTGQMAVALQPVNGTLNQQVTLQIDGLPTGATASNDAPTPLVLASNAVTITFSLKMPSAVATVKPTGVVASLALLVFPFLRRRSSIRCFAVLLFGAAMLVSLGGCGGGYLGGATVSAQAVAHSYPVTVTATTTGVTGSALVHTTTFTLVVQ